MAGALAVFAPAAAATLDLAGTNRTLPQPPYFASQAYLNGSTDAVTNNGAAAATLSEGGGAAGTSYSGAITDGTSATGIAHTGGTLLLNGTGNTFTGGLTISGGTVNLGASQTVGGTANTLVVTGTAAAGGTLNSGNSAQTVAGLTVSGSGGNAGTVTVNNGGTITAGAVAVNAGGAILQVAPGGTLAGPVTVTAGSVANAGTVAGALVSDTGKVGNAGVWAGNAVVQQGGALGNVGFWTGNATNSGNFGNAGTWTGNINNTGSGVFATTDGNTVNGITVNSVVTGTVVNGVAGGGGTGNGTVLASGGTFNGTIINNGAFSFTGPFTVASTTYVPASIAALVPTFSGSGVVTGNGVFYNTGLVSLASGATYTITAVSGGLISNNGGSISNAGTVNAPLVNTGLIYNTGTWTGGAQNAGAISNSGTWTGTLANANVVTNTGTWTGYAANYTTGRLVNSGTVTGNLGNTGTVSNSGTWNGLSSNAGTIGNSGTWNGTLFNSNGVSNTGTWGGSVQNSGTIANAGQWSGALANSGTVANNQGTWSGDASNYTGGQIVNLATWAGNLVSNTGTVNNSGTWTGNADNGGTITNAGTWVRNLSNSGTANNTGTWTGSLSNSGTVGNAGTWTGDARNSGAIGNFGQWSGNLTNSGTVTNNQGATWTGTATGYDGSLITNVGTWKGDLVSNTGTVNNSGTWNGLVNTAGNFSNSGTITGGLSNNGMFEATGGAVNGGITNNGSFDVNGTVSSDTGFTNYGTLTVRGGGVYSLTGDLLNNGTVTVDSQGTLNDRLINNNTVNINGTLNSDVTNNYGATLTVGGTVAGSIGNAGTIASTSSTAAITGTVTNTGLITTAGSTNNTLSIANYVGGANARAEASIDLSTTAKVGTFSFGTISGQTTMLTLDLVPGSFIAYHPTVTLLTTGSGNANLFQVANIGELSTGFVSYQYDNGMLIGHVDAAKAATAGIQVASLVTTLNSDFFQDWQPFITAPQDPDPNSVSGGPWIRGKYGNETIDSTALENGGNPTRSRVSTEFSGYQVGADVGVFNINKTGWNAIAGLTAGQVFATANEKLAGSTRGQFDIPFVGVYGALTNGPFHADVLYRHDFYDLKLSDAADMLNKQPVGASGDSVSLDAGYSFALGGLGTTGNFFIEPNGSLILSKVSIDSVNFSTLGIGTLSFRDVDSVLGRAGFRFGTSITVDKLALQPFMVAAVWHEFDGNTQSSFLPSDTATPVPLSVTRVGTFGQFGLGLNGELLGSNILGTIRADFRVGDKVDGQSVTAQLRYQF